MKTKQQKVDQIKDAEGVLKNSQTLIFTDFTGASVEELRALKRSLKEAGASFNVYKKRLLKIALKNSGAEFDTKQFKLQLGTIFTPGDISSVAGIVYKFSKGKENFKILGGYDLAANSYIEEAQVKAIGQLPTKDVLIGQVVGGFAIPIKLLLLTLKARAEKIAS